MSAFDKLAVDQRREREEAESYAFFVQNGFISGVDEAIGLYVWFDIDWSIRDPEGRARLGLLRQIPDAELKSLVDLDGVRNQPSRLTAELLRRTAAHRSPLSEDDQLIGPISLISNVEAQVEEDDDSPDNEA